MNQIKDLTVIMLSLFLVSIGSANSAQALVQVPTLRFGLGVMPLKFTAGTVAPADAPLSLGSMVTLNPMFLWDLPSVRSRVGFHFLADVGSKYGFISTAGIGLTFLYYPIGLSSSRELRDNDATVIKTRIAPYIQLAITPTKFSVTVRPPPDDPNYNISSSWDYFSANVIETSIGGGVDYPFSNNVVAFFGIHYRFAAISSEETKSGALNYSGMGILAGVMSNFY
jgi:hypothetical protein